MKNLRKLLLLIILAIVVCIMHMQEDSDTQKFTIQGTAQGTFYNMTYIGSEEKVTKAEIDSLLSDFDFSCSIYNPESLLSKVNNNETDSIDSNIIFCLEAARDIYEKSDSLFDVTIKPLVEAYGFVRKEKSGVVNIDSLKQFIGFEKIQVDSNRIVKADSRVQIDLNSIAQGYSVDVVAQYFEMKGIENYIIEIGGELFARGLNQKGNIWRVGIDKPEDGNLDHTDEFQEIIELDGLGLATSGNYRKFYIDDKGNRINHTINPKTGLSTTHNLLSATILAKNATLADGYATACMVLGTEKAKAMLLADSTLYGLLVYSEGDSIKTFSTPNLESKFYKGN
ncbi:MAG: FAD:protein FMN transferase [Rikenellaceae bacterium]